MGGAAVMNPNGKIEEIKENSDICAMSNGRLNNMYSLKDYILKYAFMYKMSKFLPIGLLPIFEELRHEDCKHAYNYDVTD
jgi:hypothetical protein